MLLRYNIVTERETADALLRADAYLSTQPLERNVEKGTFRGQWGRRRVGSVFSSTAIGGSGWESNPPLPVSAGSRTALKAARVTRPESLPRGRLV